MCLAVVCVEAGFSQIWSHMCSMYHKPDIITDIRIICNTAPYNQQQIIVSVSLFRHIIIVFNGHGLHLYICSWSGT